jgi:hypothetical protein
MQRFIFFAKRIMPPVAELGVDTAIARVWSPVNNSLGFFMMGSKIRERGCSR